VHFDLKGWKLEDLTQLDMAQIKDAALASQGGVVEVSGYADSIGTPGENRKISEERARTVAKQLIADGVPVTNILIHAYGSASVDLNSEAADDRENRRVEIIVY
jgi:outer membrane protein OmpA-like peptidoglycan-associated protein